MKTSPTEVQQSSTAAAPEQPNWPTWILMQMLRVLALAVLWAGLGMALGLFAGILVLIFIGLIHNRMPAMNLAYRDVAIPLAILSGSGALVWNVVRVLQAALRRGGH